MEDVQRPIAGGKENELGAWIESGIIDTRANWKVGNHFAGGRVHHNHLRLFASADKQTIRLGIVGETGGSLGYTNWKTLLDLQRLRIEHYHFSRVFAIDVDKPVGADNSLLSVAFRLHGAYNLAGLGVDRTDIVRTVVIGENPFRGWVIVDAIRPLADIDFLDELQGGWVEHRNFVLPAIAGKSVFEFRRDRDTVNARRVRDGANKFSVIGVDDVHLSRVRNVDPPRRAVDANVIPPACARYGITGHDLIVGCAGQQHHGAK